MSEPNNMTNNTNEKERNGLGAFLDNLAKPHASVTDITERQRVRFLATVLLVFATLTCVRIVIGLFSGSAVEEPTSFFLIVGLTVGLFLIYGLARSKYHQYGPFLAINLVTALLYIIYFSRSDHPESTLLWLLPVLILTSTIVSLRNTFIYAAGNVLFLLAIPQLTPNIGYEDLSTIMPLMIVVTGLVMVLNLYRDRTEKLRQAELNKTNAELLALSGSLEGRVQERTQDLALATEIGRIVSQIRDLDQLLSEAVQLIRERFDLYYTQIYLIDHDRNLLVLRAGTGSVGEQLLSQQHKLDMDESSINGRAISRKKPVIVADTEASDFFKPNPALPDTRSEMAVPLIVQDEVVGVIDLQSRRQHRLSEGNVPAFEILAGQLAIAIQNAGLLMEMEESTNFLDSVIETLPLMLFVKNADDLTYLRFNKRGVEITGSAESSFIGRTDYDFYNKDQADAIVAKDREVLAKGEVVVFEEEQIVSRDNQTKVLHITKAPVFDAHGKPQYLLGIAEDITEQKRISIQLAGRVAQLGFLNEIGQKIDEVDDIAELLEWICKKIPAAMNYSDACVASITLNGHPYGNTKAATYPRHIVEDLRLSGDDKGRIVIAYTNANYEFRDEESALIGDIGRRISNFVEGQRLFERIQEQADDLRAVSEIGTAVAVVDREHEVLNLAVELTRERFNLYHAIIFLVDQSGLNLQISAAAGEAGDSLMNSNLSIAISRQQSVVASTARNGQGIIVNDVQNEENYMYHTLLPKTRSEMSIPLIIGDNEVIGVLDIQASHVNAFDEQDLALYGTLGSQIAITLQNARQYEQTEVALQELNALQRVITGEGWQTFLSTQTETTAAKGYIASQRELIPIEDPAIANGNEQSDIVVPLSIRGANVGRLGVKNAEDLTDEDRGLLEAVSRQVAEALERARLLEESELSRQQTNALYAGSEQVIRANSMGEVLEALVKSTSISRMEQASLLFFDKAWEESPPEMLETIAVWEKSADSPSVPVGTTFPTAVYPIFSVLDRDTPLVIEDAETFELSDTTKALFKQFGTKSALAFPLVAGDLWIGILTAQSPHATAFTSGEVKQISSLVSQASVVIQTQRLFDEAESRAQQEQILRQVSERVYGAVDAESVLKTAVQEVGRALGLEAFVYLDEEVQADENGKPETAVNGTAR